MPANEKWVRDDIDTSTLGGGACYGNGTVNPTTLEPNIRAFFRSDLGNIFRNGGSISTPRLDGVNSIFTRKSFGYAADFIFGGIGSNEIGEPGFGQGLGGIGTFSYINGEANHPGILRMNNASTSTMTIVPFSASSDPFEMGSDLFFDTTFILRVSSITDMSLLFGLASSRTPAGSARSACWSFRTSQSPNWQTATRNASSQTSNTTGTAVSTATWYKLRILRDAASSVKFYLNDVLEFTHTTNVPSGSTNSIGLVVSHTPQVAVSKDVDIDYISHRVWSINR
jgi:hypothetical protein